MISRFGREKVATNCHPKARLAKACEEHEQKVTASYLFPAWSCGMSSVNQRRDNRWPGRRENRTMEQNQQAGTETRTDEPQGEDREGQGVRGQGAKGVTTILLGWVTSTVGEPHRSSTASGCQGGGRRFGPSLGPNQ